MQDDAALSPNCGQGFAPPSFAIGGVFPQTVGTSRNRRRSERRKTSNASCAIKVPCTRSLEHVHAVKLTKRRVYLTRERNPLYAPLLPSSCFLSFCRTLQLRNQLISYYSARVYLVEVQKVVVAMHTRAHLATTATLSTAEAQFPSSNKSIIALSISYQG